MSQTDTQPPSSPGWLSSRAVSRLQAVATKLRFLLAAPVVIALAFLVDRGPMWPGVLVALAGESLQLWATAHLRKNVQVIRSGPYAWLRNPMYLGRFFIGLGLSLLTWRWLIIAPFVVLYCLYAQARVVGEERRLRALFGKEHEDYCRTVRRWLPLPPRQRQPAGWRARWSWDSVLRNHELRVAGGLVLLLALLKWWRDFGPSWR